MNAGTGIHRQQSMIEAGLHRGRVQRETDGRRVGKCHRAGGAAGDRQPGQHGRGDIVVQRSTAGIEDLHLPLMDGAVGRR